LNKNAVWRGTLEGMQTMIKGKRLQTDMTHQPRISRRGFIKTTAALLGSLVGITIEVPAIAYLLSPSLRKADDDSIVDVELRVSFLQNGRG
jgi:hypothetical protein